MATDYPFLRSRANQLHRRVHLMRRQAVNHRRKTRLIHFHRLAMRRPRLALRHADRANRRMREHHGGNQPVIQPPLRIPAEQPLGQPPRRRNRHRRQRHPPGDIAHRVHPRHIRVLIFIHADKAAPVRRHPRRVQPQIARIRRSPHCPYHAIKPRRPPLAIHPQRDSAVRRPLQAVNRRAKLEADAIRPHLPPQRLAQRLVKPPHKARPTPARRDAYLRPQAVQHAA